MEINQTIKAEPNYDMIKPIPNAKSNSHLRRILYRIPNTKPIPNTEYLTMIG